MKFLSGTKKTVFIMLIVCAAVLVFCIILFKDIERRSNAISAIMNDLDQQSVKQTRYLAIKNIIEETKADREKIDSFFVGSEGTVGFIELIEKQGKVSGASATIKSVGVETGEIGKNASSSVETLTLDVETEGSWGSVYRFFSLLENLPYSMTLADVVLKENPGVKKTWKADLILKVLKLKK